MEQDIPSWRHLFALLVTIAGAYGVMRLSEAPPVPEPPPPAVMHIRMAEPPPPPPPPKAPVHTLVPSPSPKIVRMPATEAPNPTIAAPAAAPPAMTPAAPAAAVTAPAPPAPDAGAAPEAAYAAHLRAAVEAQKHYPTSKDAMLQQPRGTVSVWILLDRQGALIDAGIEQSHGSLLNQAALQSVHRATYPPFPADLYAGQTQHRFVVSLDYAPQ